MAALHMHKAHLLLAGSSTKLLCSRKLGLAVAPFRLHAARFSRTSSSSPLQATTPSSPPVPAAPAQPSPPSELSYALSTTQVQQLHTYLDYMLEVNKVMNLTAIRNPEEAWDRHILDSLTLLPVIDKHLAAAAAAAGPAHQAPSSGSSSGSSGSASSARRKRSQAPAAAGAGSSSSSSSSSGSSGTEASSSGRGSEGIRVVDVGTGAGLPGMVLAIARPEWKVTLLDSLRKRCDFLAQAAQQAGVTNVEVVWCRAEEGGQRPQLRQGFDLAVARAVAETRILAELCLPFVKVGGLWVAAKGANPQAEVSAAGPALKKLGGQLVSVDLVESYAPEGQRTAVVVAKVEPTPVKFPRKPGTPGAQPL